MLRMKNALCALLACALSGCIHVPPVPDMSGGVTLAAASPQAATVPFRLDDNRIFVEVTFIRPDGAERKALAFVNQGQGGLTLSNALFRELDPLPGRPLRLKFGAMDIAVDGAAALPETLSNTISIGIPISRRPTAREAAQGPGGQMADFAAPLAVEAVLPPGLLQHFQVVFDYGARTMTLAQPGALKPEGVAVPIRVNPHTGFAMVDVSIDGGRHDFVIDNGGSYSALRDTGALVAAHPGWLRASGGIGEANLTMQSVESDVPVVKAQGVALGGLKLDEFGAIEMGGGSGLLAGFAKGLFWDRVYIPKAGEEVDGIVAGNVLKSFRLTLDYPNRMSYWLQQAPLDVHDLDQVGLVLARWKGVTTVAAIAQKNGVDTVSGVLPGDTLLKIDGRDTPALTRGELLGALHGKPGETRRLTLERDGKQLEVDAPVTGF